MNPLCEICGEPLGKVSWWCTYCDKDLCNDCVEFCLKCGRPFCSKCECKCETESRKELPK